MLLGLTVECSCGKSVEVSNIPDELHNEDWSPVEVKCQCGEKYVVHVHMDILGK